MQTKTGSGSGGAGVEVKTGFDDPGDDYNRIAAEIRAMVDAIPIGEIAARGSVRRPSVDWLGLQALPAVGLGLSSPGEASVVQTPLIDSSERLGRYN